MNWFCFKDGKKEADIISSKDSDSDDAIKKTEASTNENSSNDWNWISDNNFSKIFIFTKIPDIYFLFLENLKNNSTVMDLLIQILIGDYYYTI